ncbi:EGF-like and EMI domain-containing protein 1 [Caerostris extrusa]|uniref:EGF-like and EMI domain-containing protein 1 n=1 Tax=Caerostris extrusa TaxID=172846 RepID=A0AAV4P8I3_CAEEX|nr:EGF-like and EMI domain-containing protein 1 [Caerostris extrusa]
MSEGELSSKAGIIYESWNYKDRLHTNFMVFWTADRGVLNLVNESLHLLPSDVIGLLLNCDVRRELPSKVRIIYESWNDKDRLHDNLMVFLDWRQEVVNLVNESLYLLPSDLPHVCTERQMESVKVQKPCTRAYTQMTKVWKSNCGHHSWCVTYEPRTVYYTGFTEAYETQYNTVAKCCNGWTQKKDEPGCFYRKFALLFITRLINML